MRTLLFLLSHISLASFVTRRHHMMSHSLITVFADTSEGGPLDILLQEDGTAILQEDGSYIIL